MRIPLLIILTLIFALSIGLYFGAPTDLSKPYLLLCLIMSIAIFVLQCLNKLTEPKPRNWFTLDILAMLSFWIVHFLFPAYWLAGRVLISADFLDIWINAAVVCRATMMSVSAMAAFALGFNFVENKFNFITWKLPYDHDGMNHWKWVANLIFVLSGLLIILLILVVGKTLFQGQYRGGLESYSGNVIIIILQLALQVSLLLMTFVAASMTGKWKIGITVKMFFLFIISYILILGNRGLAATIGLVVVFAYSESVKAISFKKLAMILFAGIFVMGVVQIARTSPERTLPSFVKTALEFRKQISVETGFVNLGASVRTLYASLDAVPSQHNYFYGKLKSSELLAFLPFGNRFLGRSFDLVYINSQYFLTWIMYGSFYSGAGTTIVADIYLDFGYVGVVVILFLLGLFCKWMQQRFRSTGSFVAGVGYCTLAVTVMRMARSGICDIIRGVFWPMLLVYFTAWIFQIKKNTQTQLLSEEEYE